MRYAIFLENEMMRGSNMPWEISLEEKRIYVPTPMIHELILPAPVRERIILTFEVGSLSATPNVNEVHVIQKSEVPNVVINEEEISPKT
jgi:hypothetical protein